MKTIFNLIVAAIIIINIADAQERTPRQNRNPEEISKMQVERLTESLALSKNQQDSIYKYALISNKESRKLIESNENDREKNFEKMRSLRENNDKVIKSFLNADQIKKYDELAKNRNQGQARRTN